MDSKTVFVFVLARSVNDFYSFEIYRKSLVKIKICRFSQKLSSESKKKSHEQKSLTIQIYIEVQNFRKIGS